jgi:predicted nuclease with TOPRIM domain
MFEQQIKNQIIKSLQKFSNEINDLTKNFTFSEMSDEDLIRLQSELFDELLTKTINLEVKVETLDDEIDELNDEVRDLERKLDNIQDIDSMHNDDIIWELEVRTGATFFRPKTLHDCYKQAAANNLIQHLTPEEMDEIVATHPKTKNIIFPIL